MSLLHHRIRTHTKPLPPVVCPPEAKKVLSRLETFTSLVHTWLDHGAPDRLRLRGIRFWEFEAILRNLYSLGVEPRCDWDQESQTAVLRMPSRIYEAVGVFFSLQGPLINQFLGRLSICAYPSVDPMGSPDLPVGEKGSTMRPDQGFRLMQQDADGQLADVQDNPRVIIETAASESREHVMAKTVGLLDPDPCYHREELGDHKVGDTVSFTGDLAREQSHIGSSSPVEGEGFDERAWEYYRRDPRHPHQLQSIVRRSEEWIPLYNSGIPIVRGEPEPELVLDLYDFLRPCSRFPHSYISDRKIPIPLGGLRRRLESALQARQNLSGHHSVSKPGSLTCGFGLSQGLHGREGQLSSATTHPIGINFLRGLSTSSTSPLLGTRSARCWIAARPMATRSLVPLFARLLVPGAAARILSRFIRR